MPQSTPRVFTIPASVPFLPTLIAALAEGGVVPGFTAGEPLAFARVTLYLPTRRAFRLARDMFLAAVNQEAAILPRIVAIGDVDEDEIAFADAATGAVAADALELPEALGGLERNALLARLILQWANSREMRGESGASLVANTPAAALLLGSDLARLMDDMTTRQVPWSKLDGLVPDELDVYWQDTLKFLKIAREEWPNLLAVHGKIEPAVRRDLLIEAERKRLANAGGPVIAAGSTGSIPATAKLLEAIATLPNGAVVLPGLDTDLDADAWKLIAGDRDGKEAAPGHPQFAMHALLRRIGIARDEVVALAPPKPYGRERLVSEVMRPAAATEHWQANLAAPDFSAHADAALATISVVEAASAEEEALAIAVALREAVEMPGKKAALVTPDRALARRVLAMLRRWNLPAADTKDDELAETQAGAFAQLAAEAALGGLEPVTLLALLKHPLCRLDRRAAEILERAILRGPRPKSGSAGLAHTLATFRASRGQLYRSDPRVGITDAELDSADALVKQLAESIAPLETLGARPQTFSAIAEQHRTVVNALGKETAELGKAFDDIAKSESLEVAPADYAELFHAALAGRTVHRPAPTEARVHIFGTLESRLQSVDRMVLGGLVEGAWPPEVRADPWLNRPMRHALGLDLPERRIGLSAHDFEQALGSPEIILTRASKLAGAPTVASRFMQRLAAVAGPDRWTAALARGEKYLTWARELDKPVKAKSADRPAPTPPLAARPTQLSVTEIEHWLRDPYTIYAKHILKLIPLDAVDTQPGVADRGTVIHAAIGDFVKQYSDELPADPAKALIEIGRRKFAALTDYPEARAFWWPRFLRIARWFVGAFEPGRRSKIAALHTEIRGEIALPLGAGTLKLSARADRIERRVDGRYAVLDYKTGAPPTERQVRTGLSPQLTLEAAILRHGGFKEIAAGASVGELVYVRLRGAEQAGKVEVIDFKDGTPDSQAERALTRLTDVAAKFAVETQPYHSLVHPMWKTRYGTYDHLARVKEWSLNGDVEGDAA